MRRRFVVDHWCCMYAKCVLSQFGTILDKYDMIYLLTAIGLSPGGSTVHIYTQTIHRTIQNKQYIEQHNNFGSAGHAPSWLVIPWHLPYNRGKIYYIYKYINIIVLCVHIRSLMWI